MRYIHLDMPEGEEHHARVFYAKVLGLREIAKPGNPASRRGIWFECGALQLHLGAAPDWPAVRAQAVLRVRDLRMIVDTLLREGFGATFDMASADRFARATTVDPFGNAIQLVQAPPELQPH